MSAEKYGRFCWAVKTKAVAGGEIRLYADTASVQANGALVFTGGQEQGVVLALAAGEWRTFFAASALDWRPVAVCDQ
jgi:hypothetical protein